MLQSVGMAKQVVVVEVEVELYSPVLQWVQMVVVVVEEVELYSHVGYSPKSTMTGSDAHKSSVLVPIWHLGEMPGYR